MIKYCNSLLMYCLFLIVFCSAFILKNERTELKINNNNNNNIAFHRKNYNAVLSKVISEKQRIKAVNVADVSLQIQKADSLLYYSLVNQIFPAWYETPWDFNGISNIPGEGEIACGYFVSTTLKHIGFNLNRYKVAQQAASVIIEAICGKKHQKRFGSKEDIIAHLSIQKDGLYLVGLDYHVGFLQVKQGQVYFIHSDYFNVKVVKELAVESTGFSATNNYVLGAISGNRALLLKWLNGTRVYQ